MWVVMFGFGGYCGRQYEKRCGDSTIETSIMPENSGGAWSLGFSAEKSDRQRERASVDPQASAFRRFNLTFSYLY